MYISRQYIWKVLTIYIVSGLLLSSCASSKFKNMSQEFISGLEMRMSLDKVQGLAMRSYGEKLFPMQETVDGLVYACRNENLCVPKNLEEKLHYVNRYASNKKNEKIYELDELSYEMIHPGDNRVSNYVVHELSLGISHMGLGAVKQSIIVFFDDKDNKVIGWVTARPM